jgi:hypothetical protein
VDAITVQDTINGVSWVIAKVGERAGGVELDASSRLSAMQIVIKLGLD